MIRLSEHKKCTGCLACKASCAFGAITVQRDRSGFVYPVINQDLCKNCGKCVEVCPALNIETVNKTDSKASYAAKNQDKSLTEGCTSGGIATACVKAVLERGGTAYGAAWIRGRGVCHIRIKDISDIDRIKGSKYVESDVTDVYPLIKSDIKNGTPVLFIGTPCQVSAVKRVCKDKLLVTMSFICGGVPSASYLKTFLEESHICFDDISQLIFRKGRTYCIEAIDGQKQLYYAGRYENPYSKAYDEGYSLRPSCLNCDYCTRQRVGDLTVGDFWGIEKTSSKLKDIPDVSCLMIHSQKGDELIRQVDSLIMDDVDVRNIAESNYRMDSVRSGKWLKVKSFLFQELYPLLGFCWSVRVIDDFFNILWKAKSLVLRKK